MKTFAGSQFMAVFNAWYYSFSPYVAKLITGNQPLRTGVKIALYPLIGILRLSAQAYDLLSFNPEAAVIAAGFIASLLMGFIYLSPLALALSIAWKGSLKAFKGFPAAVPTSLLIAAVGEASTSQFIMRIATAMLVLSTLAFAVITISIAIRKFNGMRLP
jgi:hypothetical protein